MPTLFASSIFRNSSQYIERYLGQMDSLAGAIHPLDMHLIVAEGDSLDDTHYKLFRMIQESPYQAEMLTVNHGGPTYPSVDIPQRWAQISLVCNAVLDQVSTYIQPDDYFLYVESDLVWQTPQMTKLLSGLDTFPAVAPMSMQADHKTFYDTWGHQKNGHSFTKQPPYHPILPTSGRYVELDSAGSCFAVRGDLVPSLQFSQTDCIRGIGRTLRSQGASLPPRPRI